MNISKFCLMILFCIIFFNELLTQAVNFPTSLHKTRAGLYYWYSADTSITHAPAPGFESLTKIAVDHKNMYCVDCHSSDNVNAMGIPYPVPYPGHNCEDCHNYFLPGAPVREDNCIACHDRISTLRYVLGYDDVHLDTSINHKCWDCHNEQDIMGDSVQHSSMLQAGAMKADCENSGCHDSLTTLHSILYDPHDGKLHCSACHVKSVVSCYNCHLESQVTAGVRRSKEPIHDFVLLANRDEDGKVGAATFQTFTYRDKTWAAFAPYTAHTITLVDSRSCLDCHRKCIGCHVNETGNNAAIEEYNTRGIIKLVKWDLRDSTLSWLHGAIPIPYDYQETFRFDFIKYTGNFDDPPGPSKNWAPIGKDQWDGHQMFFINPLNKQQMYYLGFDTTKNSRNTILEDESTQMASGFILKQNYPNPFNPKTIIEFRIPHGMEVSLKIYNILGREVQRLLDKKLLGAGEYKIPFNAHAMSSGIYFYRIQAPGFSKTRKMFLVK